MTVPEPSPARPRRSLRELGWALSLIVRAAPGPAALVLLCTVVAGVLPVLSGWLLRVILDAVAGRAGHAGHAGTGAVMPAAAGFAAVGLAMTLVQELGSFASNTVRRTVRFRANAMLYERLTVIRGIGLLEDSDFQNRLRLAGDAADAAPAQLLRSLISSVQGLVQVVGWLFALAAVWPPAIGIVAAAVAPIVPVRLAVGRQQAELVVRQARGPGASWRSGCSWPTPGPPRSSRCSAPSGSSRTASCTRSR
ncbi:hypothetical protein ACFQ9X_39400 [Catenulispora yoronensis]